MTTAYGRRNNSATDDTVITRAAGTIAVLTPETCRYTGFHKCLASLEGPPGTVVQVKTGTGYGIADDRNAAAESMQGDWLWMIDDDHTFAPRTLISVRFLGVRRHLMMHQIRFLGACPTSILAAGFRAFRLLDSVRLSDGAPLVPCGQHGRRPVFAVL